MRPLKLKMTAFGPYRETETINFGELKDNKLFVISGNTGSGKTTIFDGICFALYGSASGEDRDNYTMLRSDFADDQVHTAVELEFALNDRYFRVLRQLGHVKAGNKSRTGERYEFFESVDGKEVPAVDRQIVSEIDKKIEALIGLTQDQFKQIVMLPQGEFRKLLTSSTENKEAILRRLFKTKSYQQISEYMRERKSNAEKHYHQEQQSLNLYIQNITSSLVKREDSSLFAVLEEEFYNTNQVIAGLENEIQYYEEKIKLETENFNATSLTYEQQQKAFHQAQTLNEQFKELKKKEQELDLLNSQADHYKNKEKQIKAAQQASQIFPYEEQLNALEKDVQLKLGLKEEAEKAKGTTAELVEERMKQYKEEEQQQSKREQLGRKLDRLIDFLPTVRDIDKKKLELETLKHAGQKTLAEKTENDHIRMRLEDEINEEAQHITQMDESIAQLPEKERKLTHMREQARILQHYFKLKQLDQTLTKQIESKKVLYHEAKHAYQTNEKAWLTNQASILAAHLHDGEACPVCGSEHHPAKAISNDILISKEQLEKLKEDFNRQDNVFRTLLAEKNTNDLQLQQAEKEVMAEQIVLSETVETQNKLVEKGKQLKKEVEHLNTQRENLAKRKEKHKQMIEQMKTLEKTRTTIEQTYLKQKSLYDSNYAVFKDRIEKIPAEVRVLTVLEEHIKETEMTQEKLEKKWKTIQEQLQNAKEKQTTAIANFSHACNQLEETNKNYKEAKTRFNLNLAKAGFNTEEAYRSAKMGHDELAQLIQTLENYNQKKATLFQQVSELNEELKEHKQIDLTELENKLSESKKAYEGALNDLNQAKTYFEQAMNLKTRIVRANDSVTQQEAYLSMIADLYDVIRGQNSKKISFERYLQIAYLEQIIDAANHRLEVLSNGQFLLMRSNRQESHGRQSGLALDVYDGHTGQTRDVKTLSGGEKFNASLCLALGMSDVIQSFQGNISIKTMFIDEGFGSLDEESLHKSIEILIDLQESGRMIGVISHVEELKTIFPAVLEVKKSQEGHSQTRFIIK